MKIKLIITCVCLGMLGSTSLSCAGEEDATTANAESATAQSESNKGQDSAAKPAKSNDRPSGKREPAKAQAIDNSDRAKMTHADCFPKSVPDSAHNNAKLCIVLANSKPDMLFPKSDYDGMPDECKPFVDPKCR
jgi:hypothetical protein